MNDFLQLLYYLSFVPALVLFGYMVQRYIVALRNRPDIAKEDIVYQERFASGASQKNVLTKLGGARNCVRLVVTRDLLWVTSWFPFTIFAAVYDLVHVIPLRSISSIQQERFFGSDSLLLSYSDSSGRRHSLRLIPKNRQSFLRAVQPERAYSVNEAIEEPRMGLGVALRRYWRYLLGVALFPSFAFSASAIFHLPFPFLILPFIGVTLLAAWPCAAKGAPYSFWLVAMGVWMGAGFLGVLVIQLLRLLPGIPKS
jgi:hypothetical protein